VDCITETGAGALNIDGARIGTGGGTEAVNFSSDNHGTMYGSGCGKPKNDIAQLNQGRWPANFILQHVAPEQCAACGGAGCEACGGTGLVGGCQRVGTKRVKGHTGYSHGQGGYLGGVAMNKGNEINDVAERSSPRPGFADADGLETVAAWDCCAECPARRLGEQSGITSGRARVLYHQSASGFVDNGKGYETKTHADTGTVDRFFFQADWSYEVAERPAQVDPVRYCPKASRKERDVGLEHAPNTRGKQHNLHPTIKPISLCRWLATLLLPPPEYAPRRILVPFAGTGSEMIAAMLAGWEEVIGIEMDESYCAIAEARLVHWLVQPPLPGMGSGAVTNTAPTVHTS